MAKKQRLVSEAPVNPDVKLAFDTITKKKVLYDVLFAYYKGDHPLRYSTERLAKAFDKIGVYFAENWISVVVDAVLDRLSLKGVTIANAEVQGAFDDIWSNLDLELVADDVHEAATITGEAYVIAWKEEDDEGQEVLDVYFNDPRMCHVFYNPDRPRQKLFAAKMWTGQDGYGRMVLYYPDRIEHYKSTSKKTAGSILSSGGYRLEPLGDMQDGVEPNETGKIPVFHFRSGRVSSKREVDKTTISIQDAINKLFADMMASSEFSTWVQRVIISQSDPGDLENGAGINWWIPAGDGKGQAASVIELGHKDLSNFMDTMERLAQRLLIISRTPKHYTYQVGAVPSGDALLAMEAPLVKKVTKRIAGYSPEWKALVAFIAELEGKEVSPKDLTTVWAPVTSIQPLASAQTTKTEVEAGIPLETSLKRQGWTQDQLKDLDKQLKKQRVTQSSLATEELARLRAEDARSSTGSEGADGE